MSDKMPVHPDPMQTRFGPWPPNEQAESSFAAPAGSTSRIEFINSTLKYVLDVLKVYENHCPCGARPESPHTHPHVTGCALGNALEMTRQAIEATKQLQ